jgi:hypothetical protein
MPTNGGDLFFSHRNAKGKTPTTLSDGVLELRRLHVSSLLGNNGRLLALLFTEIEIPRIGWLAGKMGSRTGTGH